MANAVLQSQMVVILFKFQHAFAPVERLYLRYSAFLRSKFPSDGADLRRQILPGLSTGVATGQLCIAEYWLICRRIWISL